MDAAIQLALMSKAKSVFGNNQTFLSFPVTPLPFTKQQLSFMSDLNLTNLQAFSSLVNLIPHGEAWLPTEAQYLWDVYASVLEEADFAQSIRTPEEEAQYQKAHRFLFVDAEDDTREDTQYYRVYKQHMDAFLLAQQHYNAASETGLYLTDPAEKQRWQEVDEPALREDLRLAEVRWVVEGYKNEVEEAQLVLADLGARSPLQTRDEWQRWFMPDIDSQTSAFDQSISYPSSFTPANALEEGAWQPFRLTENEVQALVGAAPAELRARLSINTNDLSIASLAFEFSSAAILRPWFVSQAFTTRFWRFADGSKILSDGKTPSSGLCPAYVAAVVFARNVSIEEKQVTPGRERVNLFEGFHFPIASIQQPQRAIQPATGGAPNPRLNIGARRIPVTGVVNISADANQRAARRFRDLGRIAFTRSLARGTLAGGAGQPPKPAVLAEDNDDIYILAFICKQLPQCPNPDPTLQW